MPIANLLKIMSQLRNPDTGCPWDIEQTFDTIAPYTIEEAYEVREAITNRDYDHLKDELGDLLLQVVFHSQIAEESDIFSFKDVVDGICNKMIERHPHVFGDAKINTADEQLSSWEEIKAMEREKNFTSESNSVSALDGVSVAYPALLRAEKLQKRAARVGFDWSDKEPVLNKLDEEISEFKEVLNTGCGKPQLEEELGDILFTCVNIARHLKLDPETALHKANGKFTKRFHFIEKSLKKELNIKPENADFLDLENRWTRAKMIDHE
ncbi:MAG: nucleoside triphosphate pyrophosphohydrolase [Rhodospirillaceae bacterium]|nr:nucleoside triphosphate pyrophosphohydrolase [Rhodospirillaceae bacterium]